MEDVSITRSLRRSRGSPLPLWDAEAQSNPTSGLRTVRMSGCLRPKLRLDLWRPLPRGNRPVAPGRALLSRSMPPGSLPRKAVARSTPPSRPPFPAKTGDSGASWIRKLNCSSSAAAYGGSALLLLLSVSTTPTLFDDPRLKRPVLASTRGRRSLEHTHPGDLWVERPPHRWTMAIKRERENEQENRERLKKPGPDRTVRGRGAHPGLPHLPAKGSAAPASGTAPVARRSWEPSST